MGTDENQKKVFEFLLSHFETKEPFTKEELEAVTTWQGQTFGTYWSKQYHPFVIESGPDKYRVSEGFRRYLDWDKFQLHVTQMRRPASPDYEELKFDVVRIYEFFMPLTNEEYLRATLDTLFYRDTVEARLRTIDETQLKVKFPQTMGESSAEFGKRLCDWVSSHFGGYSIYHVNGRFRAGPLARRADLTAGSRYLVDETTAVTRFIFPCETPQEADQVEFFFTNLFVKAIIEVVNAEDEIWMVETGFKNRLHIWKLS
jgi:hypothetical protein